MEHPRKIGYYSQEEAGTYADIAVFDPKTIQDTATFDDPHQYSQGVIHVFVNGKLAVFRGLPTGARSGRVLIHPPAERTESNRSS